MPDHDSTEQKLTDFYHRSRVAMSGPIPRWDPASSTVAKQGWGRQLMLAGAAAVFILAVVVGARLLRENQAAPARWEVSPAGTTAVSSSPQISPLMNWVCCMRSSPESSRLVDPFCSACGGIA